MHTNGHLTLGRKEKWLVREVHTLNAKQGLSPLPRLLTATHILSNRALHNLKGPEQEAYKIQTPQDPNPKPIL